MKRKTLSLPPDAPHTPAARTRYGEGFRRARNLIAVVRPTHGLRAAINSIDQALGGGADGVLLCNLNGSSAEISLALALGVRADRADIWVGLHLLDLPAAQALHFPGVRTLNGLAEENAGVSTGNDLEYEDAREAMGEARTNFRWAGLHWGGLDPAALNNRALSRASSFVDVVTLRGARSSTHVPATALAAARAALGDHPLAVGSGVTAANCESYLPYADAFIVCEALESEPGVVDRARVAALAALVHSEPPVAPPPNQR